MGRVDVWYLFTLCVLLAPTLHYVILQYIISHHITLEFIHIAAKWSCCWPPTAVACTVTYPQPPAGIWRVASIDLPLPPPHTPAGIWRYFYRSTPTRMHLNVPGETSIGSPYPHPPAGILRVTSTDLLLTPLHPPVGIWRYFFETICTLIHQHT